jgi:hypothetical protein
MVLQRGQGLCIPPLALAVLEQRQEQFGSIAQFLERNTQLMPLLRREFPEAAATLQGLATELLQ